MVDRDGVQYVGAVGEVVHVEVCGHVGGVSDERQTTVEVEVQVVDEFYDEVHFVLEVARRKNSGHVKNDGNVGSETTN